MRRLQAHRLAYSGNRMVLVAEYCADAERCDPHCHAPPINRRLSASIIFALYEAAEY